MSTLSDLTAEITSQLPTGVSHEITAAKLRTVLIDMTTKVLSDPALLGGGGGGTGGGTLERYLTSSTSAAPGDICYCNTKAGGFTITLPLNPIPGTGVGFRDAESSWSVARLTVDPGNKPVEGIAGSLVCDVTNGNFDLVWSGGPDGWEVIPSISYVAGGTGGGGAGSSFYRISANQAVVTGGIYYCDTVGGSFTVTLPSGPSIGDGISFRDASGTWGQANLILNPGANPLNSVVSPLSVDQSDINFDLVWRGTTIGWQVQIPVTNAARGSAGSTGFLTTRPLGTLGQTATLSGGGGVIWNSADKHSNVVLSGGNLHAVATADASSFTTTNATDVRATVAGSPGRYFEITWTAGTPNGFGVANLTQALNSYAGNPNGVGFFHDGYVEWPGGGFSSNWGGTWGVGDVMGLQLDAAAVKLYKNGTLVYTVSTLPSGSLYPILCLANAGEGATANFGASTLSFLPSGVTSWDGTQTTGGTSTVWSTSDKAPAVTLGGGGLSAFLVTGQADNMGVRATRSGTANRYFEITVTGLGTPGAGTAGIALANTSADLLHYIPNITSNGIGWYANGYREGPGASGSTGTFAAGDILGVRLNSASAEFYRNGTLVFTHSTLPSGSLYPAVSLINAGDNLLANFGGSAFSFAPSGAIAWNN